jgi:hypothetical protein
VARFGFGQPLQSALIRNAETRVAGGQLREYSQVRRDGHRDWAHPSSAAPGLDAGAKPSLAYTTAILFRILKVLAFGQDRYWLRGRAGLEFTIRLVIDADLR